MRAFRTLRGFRLRLVLGLLACALLVRTAIPSGWMLMPSADGGVALMLCSGMAPDASASHHAMAQAMSGMAGKHAPRPDQPPPPEHPCAFAGLAMAMALPHALPVPILPRPVRDAVAQAILAARTPGRGLAAPPPPPTGPPFLA